MRSLALIGYDLELCAELPEPFQRSLQAEARVWLGACSALGLGAAYAGWLVLPGFGLPLFLGLGVFLMTLNLLRVVHSGGGPGVSKTLSEAKEVCRHYRPSPIPAAVFVLLAVLFAQPAQLPFWPGLDIDVEEHRAELIAQHEVAARDLGTDPAYYRSELMEAGFPVFRLKTIWKQPGRALQWTLSLCLIVFLPGLWVQVVSLQARRAYEWRRTQRTFHLSFAAESRRRKRVAELLTPYSEAT